ncbi:MAG: hypothetical protein HFH14_07875 [Lachnospiraceae bacterium]|nr:hypothetical protein [Lachnospiraceae bacterium]
MSKKVSVSQYTYSSPKINSDFDGYRIAVLSDLHANEVGAGNSLLIKKIVEINPDLVIAAGDMVSDNAKNMHITFELLKTLSNMYDIYYGCGNHELKLALNPVTKAKYRHYRRALRKIGVHYLNNKSCHIRRGGSKISVTGVNIGRKYYKKLGKKKMPDGYLNRLICPHSVYSEDAGLSILIAHNPLYFEQYAGWGADIVFSGHVHGGIMVLPFIGGVISPSLELFPKYDFGEFTLNVEKDGHTSTMYLSRGLGAHTIPIRINNRPEIMVIELKNSVK